MSNIFGETPTLNGVSQSVFDSVTGFQQSEIDALQSQSPVTLTARVESLESSRTTDETNIASNTSSINSLITITTSHTTSINTLNSNVSTLTTNTNTNTSNISTLTTSLGSTNSNVSTNTGAITILNGQVSTLQGSMTTANSNISSNTTSINSLNSLTASHTTSINSLNTLTSSHTSSINTLNTEVADLYNITGIQATAIGNNQTSITNLNTLTSTQSSDIATNASNINAANNNITTINGQITTINGQIVALQSQTYPPTAAITTCIPVALGGLGTSVQSQLQGLSSSIATLQSSGGGWTPNSSIQTFLNACDIQYSTFPKITDQSAYPDPSYVWYLLSQVNQSTSMTATPTFKKLTLINTPTQQTTLLIRSYNNTSDSIRLANNGSVQLFGDTRPNTAAPSVTIDTAGGINTQGNIISVNMTATSTISANTFNAVSSFFTTGSVLGGTIQTISGNITSAGDLVGANLNVQNGSMLAQYEILDRPTFGFITVGKQAGVINYTVDSVGSIQIGGTAGTEVINLNKSQGLVIHGLGPLTTPNSFVFKVFTPNDAGVACSIDNSGRIACNNTIFAVGSVTTGGGLSITNGNLGPQTCVITNSGDMVIKNSLIVSGLFPNVFSVSNIGAVTCIGDLNVPNVKIGGVNQAWIFPVSGGNEFRTANCSATTPLNGNILLGYGNALPDSTNGDSINPSILIGKGNASANGYPNKFGKDITLGYDNLTNVTQPSVGFRYYDYQRVCIGNQNVVIGSKTIAIGNNINMTSTGPGGQWQMNDPTGVQNMSSIIIGHDWQNSNLTTWGTGFATDLLLLGRKNAPNGMRVVLGSSLQSLSSSGSAVYMTTSSNSTQNIYELAFNPSSIKYKENIIDYSQDMDEFMKLRPVQYNLKKDVSKSPMVGLIAEEIDELDSFKNNVSKNNEGEYVSVDYQMIVPKLISVIQNLQKRIKILEESLIIF